MKGVQVEKVGAPFTVVEGLEKPKPGPNQVLVKSIATAINPVDTFQQMAGFLVKSFPVVLGCDAGGVIVEVGNEAQSKFKVGDEVCGCTRLGHPGYSAWQEFHLMDADLAMPKPKNVSIEQAATLGVGTETAALGLFQSGFGIPLIDPNQLPAPKDEWLVVLGGAGSVGQYTVQLAKAAGYKVVTTCSSKSAALVKSLGADDFIDYKKSEDDQVKDAASITGGNFSMVYDTVARNARLAGRLLNEVSKSGSKQFATTGFPSAEEIKALGSSKVVNINLGLVGRSGEEIKDFPTVNEDLAKYLHMIKALVENGKIIPNEVQIFGKGGLESIPEAVAQQQKTGGTGGKFVVKVQSP
ncbi:MAG: hypothetical protein M1823_003774 [Watsoniomyces obsoletus]|nr:MAG: hypothetical protein M1823_003774 [Watsoniomyces obsoletus]